LGCAAVCAVLAVLALSVDLPLRDAVDRYNGLRIPGDLRRALALAEVFAHGLGVLMCVAIAVALDPRSWRVAPRLGISAYGAGLLVDLFKLNIARLRPKFADGVFDVRDTFIGVLPWRAPDELPIPLGNNLRSFPSGHTGTAVGLAIALTTLYPRGRWLFSLFAVMAALQRIESQMHFLSDTLAAAALGFLVGAATCGQTRLDAWFSRVESSGAKPPAAS
jgi:membrane-associated phospholipid phosphatase